MLVPKASRNLIKALLSTIESDKIMSDIQEIEVTIKELKEVVERKNAVNRLLGNRDFKKLIMEGYFKDEAARLVGLLGEQAAAQYREEIIRSMDGIAQFKAHLRTVRQIGEAAASELAHHEQALEDLRNEDQE